MAETRNTIQRDLVLQAAIELCNHPTPEEVYNYIHEKHPRISKGTVYRNLNVLTEQGLLYKVEVPDGANRVDHTVEPHYHIECSECKRVFDVDMPYCEEELKGMIRDLHGFVLKRHHLVFEGICPECREKKEKMEV